MDSLQKASRKTREMCELFSAS